MQRQHACILNEIRISKFIVSFHITNIRYTAAMETMFLHEWGRTGFFCAARTLRGACHLRVPHTYHYKFAPLRVPSMEGHWITAAGWIQ